MLAESWVKKNLEKVNNSEKEEGELWMLRKVSVKKVKVKYKRERSSVWMK